MPAPLVLPMAGNLPTATNYAEKINIVTENKLQLTKDMLEQHKSITVAKMSKEMCDLKHEIREMKKIDSKRSVKNGRRNSSPGKVTKVTLYQDCEFELKPDDTSSTTSSEGENEDPKQRGKLENTMAKRLEDERINNLHRRYKAKISDVKINENGSRLESVKRQR